MLHKKKEQNLPAPKCTPLQGQGVGGEGRFCSFFKKCSTNKKEQNLPAPPCTPLQGQGVVAHNARTKHHHQSKNLPQITHLKRTPRPPPKALFFKKNFLALRAKGKKKGKRIKVLKGYLSCATRKPKLLNRFEGPPLPRYAERQSRSLRFHDPPRQTR